MITKESAPVKLGLLALCMGLILTAAVSPAQAGPPEYTAFDLGYLPPLPGGYGWDGTDARAINDLGAITGISYTNTGQASPRAYLWQGGHMSDIGFPPGSSGYFVQGNSINNANQIVGTYDFGGGGFNGGRHGFLYDAGAWTDLGTLPGNSESFAVDINNAGQVVGNSGSSAFLWQNGQMTNLGDITNQGLPSEATGVNDYGQVVGESIVTTDGSGTMHAFLWQAGQMMDLGSQLGPKSGATAINNQGVVVGWTGWKWLPSPHYAFEWQDGNMSVLETPANSYTNAYGVNDQGQIVGTVFDYTNGSKACLWQDGNMYDLNDLVANDIGLTLTYASDINDAGQIVGWGSPQQGKLHAFLLNPVPEPATLALLGFGAWAAIGPRKRKPRRPGMI